MKITVQSIAYHRNGTSGAPFYVVLFIEGRASGARNMMAVTFHNPEDAASNPMQIAVFDTDLIAQGNIIFGENSWRGDIYADAINKAIADWEKSGRIL